MEKQAETADLLAFLVPIKHELRMADKDQSLKCLHVGS